MEEDNNTTSDHIIEYILNMAAIKHLQSVETMYQDVLVLFRRRMYNSSFLHLRIRREAIGAYLRM